MQSPQKTFLHCERIANRTNRRCPFCAESVSKATFYRKHYQRACLDDFGDGQFYDAVEEQVEKGSEDEDDTNELEDEYYEFIGEIVEEAQEEEINKGNIINSPP